jgi:hypothetical protein
MEKKNNTMSKAHDKQNDTTTQKPKASSSTNCKKGSCSTADKKGKTPHAQDEGTGVC